MNYVIKACGSIGEIGRDAWDACANPEGVPYDPFLSYDFLEALESSACVGSPSGWAPYHLMVTTEVETDRPVKSHSNDEELAGEVLGVVPMYLKGHSQGEYVFDYGWADAFERAGGRYYPKLQVAVPFTPVTGRRLLVVPGEAHDDLEQVLLAGIMQVAENLAVSSVHVTFAEKDQWQRMGETGFLRRTHKQFHWHNDNYQSFDDFLAALSSKKRKNIRRERRQALASGIQIERLSGNEITRAHWEAFYQFYLDTGSRKWGRPYLNQNFFFRIGETMADRVLLVMCKREGNYVAGAINFIGSECLYGRNWGCIEDHPFLHFEVCYYQAIEYAIAHGLARVEAGAQGPHKLARGYMPTHTYSGHWIVNDSFRQAVENFLVEERDYVDEEIDELSEHSPFRIN
ncbi:MAG: GNAT family N-acetyltransferase [Gammaproteobacteria bacterium]|nr:GNAT family N-acetyltransferase [Gammaproteobacteria bacterium]